MYTIYQSPGWHGEPTDPIIDTTETRREAAMMAGERVDIRMPGSSNRYSCYALDQNGEEVDPIDSYRCDDCGELYEWGDDQPMGAVDGEILAEPRAYESHLVTWLCEGCAVLGYCWRHVSACECDRCEDEEE